MVRPLFSIVIPAFNEEQYISKCLDAIDRATTLLGEPVEVIVADNSSTDRTADLARERDARIVTVEPKCLSVIRNKGAEAATGRYLAFIDADSVMSDNMLVAIKEVMDSDRYVGGGVANVRADRHSLGMLCSGIAFLPVMLWWGVTAVMFYTTLDAFKAVGGFDESLYAAEDLDFGRRLKRYGRKNDLRYKNLWAGKVTTSARKLDEFGDWFVVRHPLKVMKILRNDRDTAHEFWYRDRR